MVAPLAALLAPPVQAGLSPQLMALMAALSGGSVAGAGASGLFEKPEEGQSLGDRLRSGKIFPNRAALFGEEDTTQAAGLEGGVPSSALVRDPTAALSAARQALQDRGAAALRPAGKGPLQLAQQDPAFAKLMERVRAAKEAEAGAMEKDAASRPVTKLEERLRTFDEGNKRNVPNPMQSRAVSDAVLTAAGQWLASEGRDIGGGVKEGAKAWKAARDRDEDQAQKEMEQRRKAFIDQLGMGEKDITHAEAKRAAELQAALAKIGVDVSTLPAEMGERTELRKQAHDITKIDREMAGRERVAKAGHPPKQTLTDSAIEYAKAMQAAGDTRTQPALMKEALTKGRESKEAKIDPKVYELHRQAMLATPEMKTLMSNNPKVGAEIQSRWDQLVLGGMNPADVTQEMVADLRPKPKQK